MRRAVYILILSCICLSGFAQEMDSLVSRPQPYIQVNFLTGSFWSRSEYLEKQFDAPYKAIEARFGYQLKGNKLWQQLHRYPKYGFGIHYSDLVKDRADTVVGNPFSIFGYYNAPWARFGRFTLASDLALGLSYTKLTHDFVTNPYNDVIASHINLYFNFNLNLNVKLTPRIGVDLGYGVTHYSNGRIHMPQKGVNNWGWSFGMDYKLNKAEAVYKYREPPEFKWTEAIEVMYAIGFVEGIPYKTTKELRFFTSSFTVDYAYQFNPKGAITVGLDVLYDGSLERAFKSRPPEEISNFEQMYLASHMGYHVIVDRFTLLVNVGTYFWQSSKDRGYWFVRAGGRYRFTEHLYGQISIKTKDGARSDWIEWGCVYSFKIR